MPRIMWLFTNLVVEFDCLRDVIFLISASKRFQWPCTTLGFEIERITGFPNGFQIIDVHTALQ